MFRLRINFNILCIIWHGVFVFIKWDKSNEVILISYHPHVYEMESSEDFFNCKIWWLKIGGDKFNITSTKNSTADSASGLAKYRAHCLSPFKDHNYGRAIACNGSKKLMKVMAKLSNTDSQNNSILNESNVSNWNLSRICLIVFMVTFVYCVSVGPVVFVFIKLDKSNVINRNIISKADKVLQVVYLPDLYGMRFSETYFNYMHWWLELAGEKYYITYDEFKNGQSVSKE